MKLKKIIFFSFAILSVVSVIVFKMSMNANKTLSPLLLVNIDALANGESDGGYSCSVELKCCGSLSNKKVSCTGVNKCESLKDGWGYECKGVKCDGKETLC